MNGKSNAAATLGPAALAAACTLAAGIAAAAPQALPSWTEPISGAEFIALPKGCFQMGTAKPVPPAWDSNWEQLKYTGSLSEDEVPKHEVCVDRFWLGKTEVSEAQWQKVMGGQAPTGDGRRAKVNVTWEQARDFAARLTELSGGKQRFRLPTEAEWEYACRAGDKNDLAFEREQLEGKAWYGGMRNRSYEVREVDTMEPNAFGLHNMLGNAWEWTQDVYAADAYKRHALYNPKTETGGRQRVLRGGSIRTEVVMLRCAMRGRYDPDHTMDSIGLRLVRE